MTPSTGVRKLLGERKAGHTGTLDPMATGVLPVCVGEGDERIATFLAGDDKAYEVTMRLGVRTDTPGHDRAGAGEQEPRATESGCEGGACGLCREDPPGSPAVLGRQRSGGKAPLQSGREGVRMEVPAREVEIREILLQGVEMPFVRFTVRCSKEPTSGHSVPTWGDRLGLRGLPSKSCAGRQAASSGKRTPSASTGTATRGIRVRLRQGLIPMSGPFRA